MKDDTIDWFLARIYRQYQKQNPLRTADSHNYDCNCRRCLMDKINGYLNNKYPKDWP
jgi:hypothetical protein